MWFLIILVLSLLASVCDAQAPPASQCVTTAVAGGTGDAITIPTLPCVPTTTLLLLTTTNTNTTSSPTIRPTSGPQQTILRFDGSPIHPGDLLAGAHLQLTSNGVNWFLLTLLPISGGGSGSAPLACGGIDDTTTVQAAFITAAANHSIANLPVGTCMVKGPIVVPVSNNWGIHGFGPSVSTIRYSGSNTTSTILTIGQVFIGGISSPSIGLNLRGFRIISDTKMTDGDALRLNNIEDSIVEDVWTDNAFNSPGPGRNLWNGLTIDTANGIYFMHFNALAQNDCVRDYTTTNTAHQNSGNVWFSSSFVGGGGGCKVGYHFAGGSGATYLVGSQSLLNGTNILIDTTLGVSTFAQQVWVDNNSLTNFALTSEGRPGNNIMIDQEAQTQYSQFYFRGSDAAAQNNNIVIHKCVGCNVTISDVNQFAINDGIVVDETQLQALNIIGATVWGNGRYGVNCTVPVVIQSLSPYPNSNLGDNTNSNCNYPFNLSFNQGNLAGPTTNAAFNTTGGMLGMHAIFSSAASHALHFIVTGQALNNIAGDVCTLEVRWGSGTPPVTGAPITGNIAGLGQEACPSSSYSPFAINTFVIASNSFPADWIDLAVKSFPGGQITVANVNWSIEEVR